MLLGGSGAVVLVSVFARVCVCVCVCAAGGVGARLLCRPDRRGWRRSDEERETSNESFCVNTHRILKSKVDPERAHHGLLEQYRVSDKVNATRM